MLSTITQDLTFALRQLRRSPGFALSAIVTLAFGIGATAAVFTLVDAVLLRPLPFPNPDRLIAIYTEEFPPGVTPSSSNAGSPVLTSYPNFFDWQRQTHSFDSLASYDYQERLFSKANGEGAQVIPCGRVSANLFSTLGVAPELGRDFTPEDDLPGHRVVILSHDLWVSEYGASRDAIGQTVLVSHQPYSIVGVMPAGFHYTVKQPGRFWSTFAIDAEGTSPKTSRREGNHVAVVGRLKPAVAMQQALADLNAIQRQLAQEYRENRFRPSALIGPLLTDAVEDIRPVLVLLLASVGVVLLIGCANVAGLLLARATSRKSEIAVRTALGAGRVRIIRQLLIESLLLAVCGGFLGILASILLLRVGLRLVPPDIPRLYNASINGHVLGFAVLVSAVTALIFGLLPAWRVSRSDPAHALRDSGMTMTPGRRRNRLHHALVIAETALGFSLLIGSGLLIRSMLNLVHLEPGFNPKQTVSFDVALSHTRYPDPNKVPFYTRVLPEIAAVPGVISVAAGHPLPGSGAYDMWTDLTIAGRSDPPDQLPEASSYAVIPGFFETLSIPLLRGRTFTGHDNLPTSSPVAIVNRAFAKKYFPDEDPIGHYFTPQPGTDSGETLVARQIIGVVGDTISGDSWDDPYLPGFFVPYAQNPTHQRPIVVIKVSGDPYSYEKTMREIVKRFDPLTPVFGYQSFADRMQLLTQEPRFQAGLISAFAAVALLLSALGLYAVLSYVVAERAKELALRMAFGASRSDILAMVLRRALVLGTLGIVVGIFASLLGTRLLGDLLFRVKPLDPSTFAVVTLTLLLVSVTSALAPAIRAAWLDPMHTLHEE